MKMCMRCGMKGSTKRMRITVNDGPTSGQEYLFDQEFQLCGSCVDAVLDQVSVVISNETWSGDEVPE